MPNQMAKIERRARLYNAFFLGSNVIKKKREKRKKNFRVEAKRSEEI